MSPCVRFLFRRLTKHAAGLLPLFACSTTGDRISAALPVDETCLIWTPPNLEWIDDSEQHNRTL